MRSQGRCCTSSSGVSTATAPTGWAVCPIRTRQTPQSLALATADFRDEFNTAQKIRDVIVSGSVIGRAPIVSMPHWGGILTPTEIRQLIAYLQTLK